MASKKRRFTKTKKTKGRMPTVKQHGFLEKKNIAEEHTQSQEAPQQNPETPQTPVESGFKNVLDTTSEQVNVPVGPKVTTQAYPLQSEPITVRPTIISPMSPNPTPSPVSNETQAIAQPPSLDAKSGILLRESVGSRMDTSVKLANESTSIAPQDPEPQKKSKLWVILVVILIIFAATGGSLYYFRTEAIKEITKEEKPTSSPTQSQVTPTVSQATKSASLKVDYSKYKIRVLNGSGIAGEASRVKDSLEEEKFVVKDIDNADASDYEKAVIKAKKDVAKEYLDKLKKILEKTYVLDTEEELTELVDVDLVIIIGSKKNGDRL